MPLCLDNTPKKVYQFSYSFGKKTRRIFQRILNSASPSQHSLAFINTLPAGQAPCHQIISSLDLFLTLHGISPESIWTRFSHRCYNKDNFSSYKSFYWYAALVFLFYVCEVKLKFINKNLSELHNKWYDIKRKSL